MTHDDFRASLFDFDYRDPVACRAAIRAQKHTGVTTNLAPGHIQGNLAILPKAYADDFMKFCYLNPKPCPLLDVSATGNPLMPRLGDIDIRSDLPMYRVWENGELVAEVPDITTYWRDDLVAFVIGCSLSFEQALVDAQVPLRHHERNVDCPMYITNIQCEPVGPFHGGMVVSMRPLRPADAIRAIQITSRFPSVHGAPVHIGRPDLIGIEDIQKQVWGVEPDIRDDELPVFWACGATPQNIIMQAKPSFAITHKPSHMLVCNPRSATQSML